jgi:hypothetical protein
MPSNQRLFAAPGFLKSVYDSDVQFVLSCCIASNRLEDIVNGKQIRLFKVGGNDLLQGCVSKRETKENSG